MDTHHEKELRRDELMAVVADLRQEIATLRRRVEELEGRPPSKRVPVSFSLEAEQRWRQASGPKRKQKSPRRGRHPTQQKVDDSDRLECVLPSGLPLKECPFVRSRPVWRVKRGARGPGDL